MLEKRRTCTNACEFLTDEWNWRYVAWLSGNIIPICCSFRDHFNVPACASVRSQHRVHLLLPAAPGHQGNNHHTVLCERQPKSTVNKERAFWQALRFLWSFLGTEEKYFLRAAGKEVTVVYVKVINYSVSLVPTVCEVKARGTEKKRLSINLGVRSVQFQW